MAPIAEIDAFGSKLKSFHAGDAHEFAMLLKEGMYLLDLRPIDLCEQFDVTEPTVRHWIEDKTAPHPAARELIIGLLLELAAAYSQTLVHA